MPNDELVLGIDVAEERKGLDLVGVGRERDVVFSHGGLTTEEAAFVALDELQPLVVCIDSPSAWATAGRRAAEVELSRRRISCYTTPLDPGDHPFYRWMRVGMRLYDRIASEYPLFRGGAVRGTAAEVYPAASAEILAGRPRARDEPKLAFRRAVLAREGVELSALPSTDRLDAALAALTGLLALEGRSTAIGERAEGMILLPNPLPGTSPLPHDQTLSSRPSAARLSGPEAAGRCGCGCGAPVRRRFLPGHDAKLKSRLERLMAGGDEGARRRLEELGWLGR